MTLTVIRISTKICPWLLDKLHGEYVASGRHLSGWQR